MSSLLPLYELFYPKSLWKRVLFCLKLRLHDLKSIKFETVVEKQGWWSVGGHHRSAPHLLQDFNRKAAGQEVEQSWKTRANLSPKYLGRKHYSPLAQVPRHIQLMLFVVLCRTNAYLDLNT